MAERARAGETGIGWHETRGRDRRRTLAGTALRRVEGHVRHAAHVDADRGQGRAGALAAAQSQLGDRASGDRRAGSRRDACRTGPRSFTIEFDFIDHQLVIRASDGRSARFPSSRARWRTSTATSWPCLREMGLGVKIWTMPVEIPSPIRFEHDTVHGSYDPPWSNRFWRILAQRRRRVHTRALHLHRQVQPDAFLLGRLRPGRDAVFGPAGAAA